MKLADRLLELVGIDRGYNIWEAKCKQRIRDFSRSHTLTIPLKGLLDIVSGTYKDGVTNFLDLVAKSFLNSTVIDSSSEQATMPVLTDEFDPVVKITRELLNRGLDLPHLVGTLNTYNLGEVLYGMPIDHETMRQFKLPFIVTDGHPRDIFMLSTTPVFDMKREAPSRLRLDYLRYIDPDPTGGSEIGGSFRLPYSIHPDDGFMIKAD